ncbi:MAG: hypothetical protein V2A74_01750 [bacterium]
MFRLAIQIIVGVVVLGLVLSGAFVLAALILVFVLVVKIAEWIGGSLDFLAGKRGGESLGGRSSAREAAVLILDMEFPEAPWTEEQMRKRFQDEGRFRRCLRFCEERGWLTKKDGGWRPTFKGLHDAQDQMRDATGN